MKTSRIISLVLISIILSCTFNQQHSIKDIAYLKYKEKVFKDVSQGFLIDSIFGSSRRLFQYYDKDSDLIYRLDLITGSDSVVIFNGENLLKTKKKEFLINNKTTDIYKYDYGIKGTADGEAYIFINYAFGIVGINYFPWGLSVFPEGKEIQLNFKDALLKPENESFFE